ncbi:DUF1576 domain-containing protein [uncultured Finegoldia sp.]|uniref:DUF1576 domain-containing protein n=1 Tax=uncultured Finegoldia sp. TaxID=328009 RepID=UPI00262E81F4|nr:DUF1576 domain-containing protein [uncultured Finegoldia sp.]
MKEKVFHSMGIYKMLYFFAALLMLTAFVFNTPAEIFNGLVVIIKSPCTLITDYMYLANIGAAFFNAGIICLMSTILSERFKVVISGPGVAAIFTMTGFAFFGKNLFNTIPITLGVLIYSKIENTSKASVILPALFGSALGPLISEIAFNSMLSPIHSIIISYLVGISIGIIMVPLSGAFLRFHQGYNLYNMGFTAGIVGMLCVGILRMFSINIKSVNLVYPINDLRLIVFLYALFILIFLFGFVKNNLSFHGYENIMYNSGRLATDFISLDGLYQTMINMGIMGFIATTYIIIVGGKISGPIIGGIFTVTGFAAFGKHPKNTIPVFVGVFFASILNTVNPLSTSSLLAALFGTTLAPIAGEFGFFRGALAGFLHMAMVLNIGVVHGGVNLYNNGFSGGFVAGILVPVFREMDNFIMRVRLKNND